MAAVGANAVITTVPGSPVASAYALAWISVPQMLQYGYDPHFAVRIVEGSSVLGMIDPSRRC